MFNTKKNKSCAGYLIAVGQQSGKANRASQAKDAIGRSRANCSRAIGHLGQSGESGKRHNRASQNA